MSSRSLRKALAKAAVETDEGEDFVPVEEPKNKKQNLFALLNGDGSSDSSTESESDSDTTITAPVAPVQSRKPPKKASINEEEDLDALMAQFGGNQSKNSSSSSSSNENQSSLANALKLDPDWLDASVELKRKFGGAAVGSGGNSALSQINARLLRANPQLSRALKRKPFKRKNGFITPRPLWPPFAPAETGLSCQPNPATPGSFELVEEAAYKDLVQELLVMIQSGDLEFLMQLVQSCPLFVDGLLLMSDAYRMQSTGDAGEIVERAVYILERILPAEADFLQGTVRFPYSQAGNRKLHLALFRLCQFTCKQGCWRVALQVAKALLQLDPANDPLCARLLIEFLALQAGEYDQFDLLYAEMKKLAGGSQGTLADLPSWSFSRALRMFLEEEESKQDHSVSSEELREAIKASPITAKMLAAHLKVAADGLTTGSDAFITAAGTIFLARCGMLWRGDRVTEWFRSSLKSFLAATPDPTMAPEPVRELSLQVPIYRHALLSDLSNLNVAFPPVLTMHLNAFDPCPPEFFEDAESGNGVIGGLLSRIRSLMA